MSATTHTTATALARYCGTCAHIGTSPRAEPCRGCRMPDYAGWELHEAHALQQPAAASEPVAAHACTASRVVDHGAAASGAAPQPLPPLPKELTWNAVTAWARSTLAQHEAEIARLRNEVDQQNEVIRLYAEKHFAAAPAAAPLEPKLDKPAKVTPEKEAERIAAGRESLALLQRAAVAKPEVPSDVKWAAIRTREDLGEHGTNYPDIRAMLGFIESLAGTTPGKECRCTFAQRMQGSGCEVCNPDAGEAA